MQSKRNLAILVINYSGRGGGGEGRGGEALGFGGYWRIAWFSRGTEGESVVANEYEEAVYIKLTALSLQHLSLSRLLNTQITV